MRSPNVLSASRRKILKYFLGSVGAHFLIGNSSAQSQDVTVEETSSKVILNNSRIRLQLSKHDGGIEQIEDIKNGVTLRDRDGPNSPRIWDIRFYTDDFSWLSTGDTNNPIIELSEMEDRGEVTLTWENPTLSTPDDPEYNRKFDATITITIQLEPSSPDLLFDFDLTNRDSLAVRRVQYPLITDISGLESSGEDKLILPIQMGRQITNPTETDSWYQVRYPSGFGTMQYSAYTSSSGGFFIQSRDEEGYIKQFKWGSQGENVDLLKFFHQFDMPQESGADVGVPYSLSVGAFSGDWYDTADKYKSWLDDSELLPNEPMEIPDWYYEQGATATVTSYRRGDKHPERETSFDTTVDKLVQTREELDTPLQVLWNGYQTHGKYGYGDWFPPYEGWESFRENIQRMEDNEISLGAFVGATNLYQRSDLWQENTDEAKQWVIRDKDQSIKTTETMGFTVNEPHLFADGWVEELRKTSRKLVSEGVNQIWFDGVPWGKAPNFPHRTCFAERHDHPLGTGGKWWANRVKTTYSELKDELLEMNESLLLSGEGIAEYFIPQIDIQHTRDVLKEFRGTRMEAKPIPLTKYALEDHLLIRGNITAQLLMSHQDPSFVRLGLARSLNWGALPAFLVSVHRDSDELLSDQLIGYASRIAKQFQINGQRFLTAGKLLRQPDIDSPETKVRLDRTFLGREGDSFRTSAIQASAWESGDETERAIMLTNIDSEPVKLTIPLDKNPFIKETDRLYYTVHNGRYEIVGKGPNTDAIEITVSQHDVVLLVSAPETADRSEALQSIAQAQVENVSKETIEQAQAAFTDGEFQRVNSTFETSTQNTEATTARSSRETDQPAVTSKTVPETTENISETAEEVPGFGVSSVLGALGGIGYILKSRFEDD